MSTSPPNSSYTVSSYTRSRSSSICSLRSIKEEEVLPEKYLMDSATTQPCVPSADDITTVMLTRGLQATIDATHNSEKMKHDIKSLHEITSRMNERIKSIEKISKRMEDQSKRMEDQLMRIEQNIDIYFHRQGDTPSQAPMESSETYPPPKPADNPMSNAISSWIRTSLNDQKMATRAEWNLDLNFKHQDNVAITNTVIDYVATQITATTNVAHWVNLISYKDLQAKICLVFRRHRTKKLRTDDRHAEIKKYNIRKSRRVTKTLHRKQILSHEVHGKTMRDLFGDDVENLAIEQLQSDEESTDTEMGETERGALKVMTPSWRSQKGIAAFKKFDELDLILRPHSTKEKACRTVGRVKRAYVKEHYFEKAPLWSKILPYHEKP